MSPFVRRGDIITHLHMLLQFKLKLILSCLYLNIAVLVIKETFDGVKKRAGQGYEV